MSRPVPIYDASDATKAAQLLADIEAALRTESEGDLPSIPPYPDLIGIDDEVYRQINAALQSGKRHIMFYGPPGTGKTTLAQLVASTLSGEADNWKLITGSSDWTSQDIIGGYQPFGSGQIAFFPGVLLEHFDKPLIIDELNRCDIDKVIGPLFTVLSDQPTVLPYLFDANDRNSARITILPEAKAKPEPCEYAPGPKWRLIATINSLDKTSLYQMSYALTRRFGWVLVDTPNDPVAFISGFLTAKGYIDSPPVPAPESTPLAEVWKAVNAARAVGPAPIIDMIRFLGKAQPGFDFFSPMAGPADARVRLILDAFQVFLLPMMDGILRTQGEAMAARLGSSLMITELPQMTTLKSRIIAMTV